MLIRESEAERVRRRHRQGSRPLLPALPIPTDGLAARRRCRVQAGRRGRGRTRERARATPRRAVRLRLGTCGLDRCQADHRTHSFPADEGIAHGFRLPVELGVNAISPGTPRRACAAAQGSASVSASRFTFLELVLDRLAQLGELREHVQRLLGVVRLGEALQLGARLLQPCEELLRSAERVLGAHRPTFGR